MGFELECKLVYVLFFKCFSYLAHQKWPTQNCLTNKELIARSGSAYPIFHKTVFLVLSIVCFVF